MSLLEADKIFAYGGWPFHPMEELLSETTVADTDVTAELALPSSGYSLLRVEWDGVEVDTDDSYMGIQFSDDAGATWKTTAGDYDQAINFKGTNGGNYWQAGDGLTSIQLCAQGANEAMGNHGLNAPHCGALWISEWETTNYTHLHLERMLYETTTALNATQVFMIGQDGGAQVTLALALDRMRFMLEGAAEFEAGGNFRLYGIKEST